MRMIRGLGGIPAGTGPTVVTMGNFDGVHLGHREILKQLVQASESRGLPSCVITFFPHPLKVLRPEMAPSMIISLEDRQEEIEKAGADYLEVIPFTLELAAVGADDFVRDHLVDRLECRELFVGRDARFGRGREGDVDLLARYADDGAFELHVVPAVEVDGTRVSSSKIRRCIESGSVRLAEKMIGRPFSVSGEVVSGAGRGTSLGFPTANVMFDGEIKPRHGVYACIAATDRGEFTAAVHHGPIPTFGSGRPVMEAHLLGFEGDLVGTRMRLQFLEYLREIRKFDGVQDLVNQIAEDVGRTEAIADERDGGNG